jgi:hypothetical protein
MTNVDLAAAIGNSVTLPAFQAPSQVSVTMSNVPAPASGVHVAVFDLQGSDPESFSFETATATLAAGTATATVPSAAFGDHAYAELAIHLQPGLSIYWSGTPALPATISADAAAMIRAATADSFDAATRTLSWTEATGGTPASFVGAKLMWTHAGGVVRYGFRAPYQGATVVAPALPAPLASVAFGAGDAVSIDQFVLAYGPGLAFHDLLLAGVDMIDRYDPGIGADVPASYWFTTL